jgi:glucose-6-phosphate isomerase
MLALLAVWHQNFCGIRNHIVLPYEQRLQLLPAYLQQLFMESLGKSVRADGAPIEYPTGCPVWGSVGSHSQHSFAQLLHQGNSTFQVDYIAAVNGQQMESNYGHRAGLANMLAQAESLARGQTKENVASALRDAGVNESAAQQLLPHKIHQGNRPSNIILLRKLNARNLGAMLAMYEHQVFVQAMIWGINPFDQWGVELGKIRAGEFAQSIAECASSKLPPIGEYIFSWLD